MQKALESLPCVEKGSVQVDLGSQQVSFNLKDKTSFDVEELKSTIAAEGYQFKSLLAGPK